MFTSAARFDLPPGHLHRLFNLALTTVINWIDFHLAILQLHHQTPFKFSSFTIERSEDSLHGSGPAERQVRRKDSQDSRPAIFSRKGHWDRKSWDLIIFALPTGPSFRLLERKALISWCYGRDPLTVYLHAWLRLSCSDSRRRRRSLGVLRNNRISLSMASLPGSY